MKTYSKRIFRSKNNKVFMGVMGGFGEYFNVDPTLFRVIYTGFTVFSGIFPGILAYILMALIMPIENNILEINS